MNNERIAVLIPCYNEEGTIAKVVSDFKHWLPESTIYVCDNASTDATADVARRAGAVVLTEKRKGKGNAVRCLFNKIDADCYLLVDGDDTYPAESARALCEKIIDEGCQMAIGDRLSTTYSKENKRRFHDGGNRLVRFLINHIFNSSVGDIMTGYRAFSREFVRLVPVISNGFEIETEMTIFALNHQYEIGEVPVAYRDRPEGSYSKLSTLADGWRVLKTVFRLFRDYRPLLFFSYLSMLLLVLAVIMFVPVYMEYLKTGLVPRFPTLIVCGFTALIGVLLWLCGLVLEVMMSRHRRVTDLLERIVSDH